MQDYIWGDSSVSQQFGVNAAAYARFGLAGHNGIDLAVWTGTPINAAEDGVVVSVSSDPTGYGLTVYLAADSGRGWRYGHFSRIDVAQGQRVSLGEQLGLSGNTGNSSGPHLHLGMRPPGYAAENGYGGYVDPMPVLVALQQEQDDSAAGATGGPTQEDDDASEKAEMTRIQELEAERDGLNGVNSELQNQIDALREEIAHLRDEVIPPLEASVLAVTNPVDLAEIRATVDRLQQLVAA